MTDDQREAVWTRMQRARVLQYESGIPCGKCGHDHIGRCALCDCEQIEPPKASPTVERVMERLTSHPKYKEKFGPVGDLSDDLLLDNFHWSQVSEKVYDLLRAELVRRLNLKATQNYRPQPTHQREVRRK